MGASDSTVEWRGASGGDDARILVRLMAGYRYTAAAQSGGRGSNTTEILTGLDRSTTWLGPERSVPRAASASRITRAHRSPRGSGLSCKRPICPLRLAID